MPYRYRYDREVLNRLLVNRNLSYLEVCQKYEKKTGQRIEIQALKDLIRREVLVVAKEEGRQLRLKRAIIEEIIADDPWIIAYPQQAHEQYLARCKDDVEPRSVRYWLRQYGIAAARRSPYWEEEVLDVIKERRLTGYLDPESLAD